MLFAVFICFIAIVECRPAPLTVQAEAHPQVQKPGLGAAIDGQYVVVFKQDAGSAAAASAVLKAHVQSALATSHAARASSVLPSLEIVGSIGNHAHSSDAAAQSARAGAATGLQGIVVSIQHQEVLAAVQSASNVAAVFPDRVLGAQQAATCINAQQLSKGLATSQVSATFAWRYCLSARTELRWIGQRCGAAMDQILYTAVYAVYKNSGVVARVSGQECILTPNATANVWSRLRFGGCGTPPVYAPLLPTCIDNSAAEPAATAHSVPIDNSSDSSSNSSGSCITADFAAVSEPLNTTIVLSSAVRCGSRAVKSFTYFGVPCGPDGRFVQWTRAVGPGGCELRPNQGQVKYNNDLFGACGVPPGLGSNSSSAQQQAVPTMVCNPPGNPSPSPEPVQPSPSPEPVVLPSPSPSAEPVQPSPSPQPVVLPSPSPSAEPVEQLPVSPSPAAPEGSPSPAPNTDAATSPSPQPSGFTLLPRVAVEAGDSVPSGVQRIEAATAAGVASNAGLPVNMQVVVGIMDSGIDGTHPDINYAGGLSWISASAARPNDAPADVDNYGHGTHVAGIVAARNNGQGVVGVAPGLPVYSLKVLDGAGRGSLSTVMSAMKWVASTGVQQGIKVINLSLAAFVDPASPDFKRTADAVCAVFKEAADAGVVVVVAAGNYGTNVQGYLPASCPTVATVTALDADGLSAATFSNYMASDAPVDELARVLAAPGTYIRSTIPYAQDASGYGLMSGTSMAAPHVSGVAANCIMSGACTPGTTGMERLAAIQAAAKQRYQLGSPAYGFVGDATSTAGGHYYGWLVWSGAF